MELSVNSLWDMPRVKLLATCHAARRLYVEKRFSRDTAQSS